MTIQSHWVRWHLAYEDPASPLSRRLATVQHRLGQALSAAPQGRVRILSMCAGQGRDVIDVVAAHRRRGDVTARLVELDPQLVADARARCTGFGLDQVEVVAGDASRADAYAGMVPADIVLVCGVFGNIAENDIATTIAELPHLCSEGASVIWTRHRGAPDMTPTIRRWFSQRGFAEVAFDTLSPFNLAVGAHRLVGATEAFREDRVLFSFLCERPSAPPAAGGGGHVAKG